MVDRSQDADHQIWHDRLIHPLEPLLEEFPPISFDQSRDGRRIDLQGSTASNATAFAAASEPPSGVKTALGAVPQGIPSSANACSTTATGKTEAKGKPSSW